MFDSSHRPPIRTGVITLPAGRHRKTTSAPVRLRRWGALTVPVLAVGAVVPAATALEPTAGRSVTAAFSGPAPDRRDATAASRSYARPETPPPQLGQVEGLAERAVATSSAALTPRWTTDDLVVWSDPGQGSRFAGRIDAGRKVLVTGAVQGRWAQIARGQRLAWVRRADLAQARPTSAPGATGRPTVSSVPKGISGAACPDGSGVESGLTANAINVYRAVCAAFPQVSAWGGRSGGGDHGSGHALDIMSSGALGSSIAAYLRANAGRLGVSYVIFAQRIWTVERSSEGWRAMPDRGSTTANHYDHVHVTVY